MDCYPNWIYSGTSTFINYKEKLANEKSGINKNISKNGWGFFHIAFKK